MQHFYRHLFIGMSLIISLAGAQTEPTEPEPNTPIEHFIFLMQENHTFDNYFGTYPGADGFPEGTCMPLDNKDPQSECIEPFHIGNRAVLDLGHSRPIHDLQYNDGKMDGFIAAHQSATDAGELAMGYYDDRDLPYYWNIADEYVLFDRFFSSAAGGSVWNHLYWVTGTPGNYRSDTIPEEGFGDLPTIFDRLEEKGISWKFYVQNYDPTITYRLRESSDRGAQIVWVPLLNYARYLDDPNLFGKIVDLNEYFDDLENGTLPAVAFMVPSGASEHPPGSIQAGQRFVRLIINALKRSEFWDKSAFMWTYDDWGGWYDHVPPPIVDEFGYGFRVPTLLVSAYAKKGYVDSTVLDYTSGLKFIQENWDLEPLAERDANANSFVNAFDFTQAPRPPRLLDNTRPADLVVTKPRRDIVYIAYTVVFIIPTLLITWAALGARARQRQIARSLDL